MQILQEQIRSFALMPTHFEQHHRIELLEIRQGGDDIGKVKA
jgi:hypothetical protein